MATIIKTVSGAIYVIHSDNTVTRKGGTPLPINGTLTLTYPLEWQITKGDRLQLRDANDQPIISSSVTHMRTLPDWV